MDVHRSLLTAALVTSKLKGLDLGGCRSVTSFGWQLPSACLHDNSGVLEVLDLRCNSIDDESLVAIGCALCCNTNLKRFRPNAIIFVTNEVSFSHYLQHSVLKSLELRVNGIDDRAAISFARKLARNTMLDPITEISPLPDFCKKPSSSGYHTHIHRLKMYV